MTTYSTMDAVRFGSTIRTTCTAGGSAATGRWSIPAPMQKRASSRGIARGKSSGGVQATRKRASAASPSGAQSTRRRSGASGRRSRARRRPGPDPTCRRRGLSRQTASCRAWSWRASKRAVPQHGWRGAVPGRCDRCRQDSERRPDGDTEPDRTAGTIAATDGAVAAQAAEGGCPGPASGSGTGRCRAEPPRRRAARDPGRTCRAAAAKAQDRGLRGRHNGVLRSPAAVGLPHG